MRHVAPISSLSALVAETVVVTALGLLRSASHLLLLVVSDTSWRIDPSKLPRRLDLEVSDHTYKCLLRLSGEAGVSVRDLAERLISQSFSAWEMLS